MSGTVGAAGSRTDEVLSESFVEGLEDLPTDEVRRRRDLALAEREFHSYLRRLLQVRQDLLTEERRRRESGTEGGSLVERLTDVLSEGPSAVGSRGEAVRFTLSGEDVAEAERRADAAAGDTKFQNPESLSDEQLDDAIAKLEAAETEVSSLRTGVLRVHDRLQEELKRRYREDPGSIPLEL